MRDLKYFITHFRDETFVDVHSELGMFWFSSMLFNEKFLLFKAVSCSLRGRWVRISLSLKIALLDLMKKQ